ncbi:calcium-binding protein (plasmid) [Rhizobium sp. TH2]|uniref:calcium-binding protein n=1 Tax=Rhizobium sp. TH2 TaxID=2775403 RepID=UPI002157D6FD|nr:calcium-binding protein [Rhizobium sp. TH2]UVC12257.1 calcium-binding protein [Rhizobium sp. TH2]
MSKHIISSNTSQPLIIKGSGNTWVIDTSALIVTGQVFHETALSEVKGAHGNTIVVNGAVIGGAEGDDDGIVLGGRDTRLIVGDLGVVQGQMGIQANGRHQSITNHGDITVGGVGIFAELGGKIINDGTINAGTGIWSNSGLVKIVNRPGAEILCGDTDTAINVQGEGGAGRIINHGTIEAYYYAVNGGELADVITNRGVMKGTISLGSGNDVFDNRGGSVDHVISTDSGNDILITDDASVSISESENGGRDMVKSTVGYILNAHVEDLVLIGKAAGGATGNELNNHLDGNSAFNVIQGLAGKDRLDGHKGNDVLFGGTEVDVFVFGKSYGDDTIADFVAGLDRIDLRGSQMISSFADFKAHAIDTGADITLHAGKDSLRIQGIDLADLHGSDFIF